MRKLLDFLYPSHCQLCGEQTHGAESTFGNIPGQLPEQLTEQLCHSCSADIPRNHNACHYCALPLPTNQNQTLEGCANCIKSPPNFDYSWSPYVYAQPLEWMIQQLKFNAKLSSAPLLSNLIAEDLPVYLDEKPDVIIPMPLHNKRLKQRGFNQSHLLINPVAKKLGLAVDINSAQRIRDTPHQTGKNARQRQKNIKNAFSYTHKNHYQHVVIFDDVVTTGSSVTELTKTLKQGGVHRVDVWCLARAKK